MAKQKQDRLPADEVQAIADRPFYRPGVPYLWVLTHGWCCVGFYVGGGPTPMEIRVAHASYYRSAGNQTHASLARNGGNSETRWEYMGDELITRTAVIRVSEYHGEVARGRLAV